MRAKPTSDTRPHPPCIQCDISQLKGLEDRALHKSPEWCKAIPRFTVAKQSWDILLLYTHRHFIRGHQGKFCLCFAFIIKKGIPQNKQNPFFHHLWMCFSSTRSQPLQKLLFCSNLENVLSSFPPPLPFPTWGIQLLAEKLEKRKKE